VRGGSRVTFLCGGRALAGFRALRDAVAGSVRALSVLPADLPPAIERLQQESKDLNRLVKDLGARIAVYDAQDLAASAEPLGETKAVLAALAGRSANELKTIASRIVENPGHVAILISDTPPLSIVVARAAGTNVHAGALLRQLVERHGGKGGGRPELAQGGGLTSAAPDVLQSARTLLRQSV